MNLIVSLGARLETRYGAAGRAAIADALTESADALGHPIVLSLDDAEAMMRFDLAPVPSLTAAGVLMGVRQLRQRIPTIDGLLIVGGHEIVPHWELTNPVTDRAIDPDPLVATDNPYGTLSDTIDSYLAPDLPVGRLVNPGAGANDLAELIRTVAGNHVRRTPRRGAIAIFNADWEAMSDAVAEQLPEPVQKKPVPGYQLTGVHRADLSHQYLYFNLHGFMNDPAWKGFEEVRGQFFAAATPESFDAEHVSGAVAFVENCYGALTHDRSARTSCAIRLLQQGAAAVIGATGLAFGSHLAPGLMLENGDVLAAQFFTHSTAGVTVGRALTQARRDYLGGSAGAGNPYKQKTLLQFVLLGDPSLT